MSEVYVRDFSLCSPNVKVKPEADSGFKKGGSNILDAAM